MLIRSIARSRLWGAWCPSCLTLSGRCEPVQQSFDLVEPQVLTYTRHILLYPRWRIPKQHSNSVYIPEKYGSNINILYDIGGSLECYQCRVVCSSSHCKSKAAAGHGSLQAKISHYHPQDNGRPAMCSRKKAWYMFIIICQNMYMFIIHTCDRTERVNIRIKYATKKVFRDATKHLERYNMLRTPTSTTDDTLLRGA